MLIKRSKTSSSFGPGGRRIGGAGAAGGCASSTCGQGVGRAIMTKKKSSSSLFAPGNNIRVQRAPIMTGLSVIPGVSNSVLQKKFQRPMMKRRAYQKGADRALHQSSLGQRKRRDGGFLRYGAGAGWIAARSYALDGRLQLGLLAVP